MVIIEMFRIRYLRDAALAAIALSTVLLTSAGRAAADALGPVVLSRAHGDALAVWDATPELSGLVAAKTSATDTLHKLEADACALLLEKAKLLAPDAKTMTVSVIYQRTGAISPTYQVATFAGIERLLTVKAAIPIGDAAAALWTADLKAGKIPSGVTVVVAGKLPPDLH
jgi:hypothetical protein